MSKALFGRLNTALRLGFAPLALAVCVPVMAQQLTPDQTSCRNRGNVFSLDEQINGCTAVLQSDRTSAGNRAVAYLLRGIAYDGKKDDDRAIADFNEALKINPNFAEAYNNRGSAVQAKGDYDRAIADYSEAIRINPNYAVAYSNRGNLLQARGRREDAIADFQRALAIDPNHERSRAALKQLGAAP
jgi:tetratricopeptide (TPR) repeat protein